MQKYKYMRCLLMMFLLVPQLLLAVGFWHEESAAAYQAVTAINDFDYSKFQGKWYEVARLPFKDEKYIEAPITIAYPAEKNNLIRGVIWYKLDGLMESTDVVLRFCAAKNIGKLQINFTGFGLRYLGIGWIDYWVIYTDYNYALIGAPDRDYLWVLSRTSNPDTVHIKQLLDIAKLKGFDLSKLIMDYAL